MTDKAEIIVVRALHPGIYSSHGGGKSVTHSRHAAGPRGLANAVKSHYQERHEACQYFGNIGMGAGWIEVVPEGGNPGDGMRLGHPTCGLDTDMLPKPPAGGASYTWWRRQLEQQRAEYSDFLRCDADIQAFERASLHLHAEREREDREDLEASVFGEEGG